MVGSWRDERSRLFRDAKDYRCFLERLGEGVDECHVRLYLFCLMANHFHLVLETPEGNLSRFMQKLSTAYTVYYNLRHRRHRHLFEGRFKVKLMEGDKVLEEVARGLGESVAAFRERRRNSPLRAIAGRLLAKYAGMR